MRTVQVFAAVLTTLGLCAANPVIGNLPLPFDVPTVISPECMKCLTDAPNCVPNCLNDPPTFGTCAQKCDAEADKCLSVSLRLFSWPRVGC